MSVVMSAVGAVQSLVAKAALVVAAQNGEVFDPDKVTPGPEGFIATAVFAGAVILLGFLLVKRIRRNSFRHEIREGIEAELAEAQQAGGEAAGGAPDAGGSRPAGN